MKKIALISVILVLCIPVFGFPQAIPGGPLGTLQQQMSTLQTEVINLQTQMNNIGITKAVHGYRLADGTTSGTGFTMTYDSTHQIATIHFDAPFPGIPHCFFISANYSPDTTCVGGALNPSTATVQCRTIVYVEDMSTGNWEIDGVLGAYGEPIGLPFKFICVF